MDINVMIQQAQNSNSAEEYEEIARAYFWGRGVSQNRTAAFNYYKKAADLGSVNALTCVGICYYRAYGVPKNVKLAKKTLISAADRGSVDALRELGWMCYNND